MDKRVFDAWLKHLKHGTLSVTFIDGTTKSYGRGEPKAAVTLRSKGLSRKMLRTPSLAIGEAYTRGDIEIHGPIENFLKLAELNTVEANPDRYRKQWRRLHKNIKPRQKRYISHHYDLGNDFYQLWLDPTMNYSCAYFKTPRDTLQKAQQQKTEHILRKLQLKPGQKLLDIGCGWGYLLVQAAKQYKIKGVGVTLSEQQYEYARQLAKREGVDRLVKFRLENYLDVAGKENFDRIVSVGFFEHVGHGNLNDYFKKVNYLLKPDGISLLHSITHQKETPSDAWIEKYIFPGGYIPSVRETTYLLPEHDFYLFDYENLGQHYAMTIEKWWRNYEKNKKKVINMYDENFYRMWRLYLLGSMLAFRSGHTQLSQWTFKKGANPAWPLTREYLYKK
ncbi:cyclopropane-fatty-acyl-phospholipid synthase family protein [Candidatus Parcubacteria bacterium]|nr:cyclopropane-fatty-acyl-phospholipid synthase family protein [Candidatus Parcubacteria bacterium]